ncbi:MAG TPA: rod shape-determining protein [Candidatus Methanofastidiosa archaeon]|nr:rod shape-determining protein [Candidatus Methanofastidiosa archaeon]HPR41615.1 rod shape-determining protein [Candidatus Methanofastidiosa archaeon]
MALFGKDDSKSESQEGNSGSPFYVGAIKLGTANSTITAGDNLIGTRSLVRKIYKASAYERSTKVPDIIVGSTALEYEGLGELIYIVNKGVIKTKDAFYLVEYLFNHAEKHNMTDSKNLKIFAAAPAIAAENQKEELETLLKEFVSDVKVISEPLGSLIYHNWVTGVCADIGHGTTDFTLIHQKLAVKDEMGEVVADTIPMGGRDIDFAVQQAIKKKYGVEVPLEECMRLKEEYCGPYYEYIVTGKELPELVESVITEEGLGQEIVIDEEVIKSVNVIVDHIAKKIVELVGKSPFTVRKNLYGAVLVNGGISSIRGLEITLRKYIAEHAQIPLDSVNVVLSQDPLHSSILGAKKAAEIVFR